MTPPVEKEQKSVRPERGRSARATENGITLQAGIFDQLHDAVITTDLQGNITACNKGVSLYGYAPEELAGKNISGLYRPEEQVFLARQVIPTVLEKGRFEGELRSRAKSGEDVYVHLSMTLLRAPGRSIAVRRRHRRRRRYGNPPRDQWHPVHHGEHPDAQVHGNGRSRRRT